MGNRVKTELIINSKEYSKNFNYLISADEAETLFKVCEQPVPTYYKYYFGVGKSYWTPATYEDVQMWWIKEFIGPHAGITITGVELNDLNETLYKPNWVGTEIVEENYLNTDLFSPTKIELATGKSTLFPS